MRTYGLCSQGNTHLHLTHPHSRSWHCPAVGNAGNPSASTILGPAKRNAEDSLLIVSLGFHYTEWWDPFSSIIPARATFEHLYVPHLPTSSAWQWNLSHTCASFQHGILCTGLPRYPLLAVFRRSIVRDALPSQNPELVSRVSL